MPDNLEQIAAAAAEDRECRGQYPALILFTSTTTTLWPGQ